MCMNLVYGDGEMAVVVTDTGATRPDGQLYEHGRRVRRLDNGAYVGLSGDEARVEALFRVLASDPPGSHGAAARLVQEAADELRATPAAPPPPGSKIQQSPTTAMVAGRDQDGTPWAGVYALDSAESVVAEPAGYRASLPADATDAADRIVQRLLRVVHPDNPAGLEVVAVMAAAVLLASQLSAIVTRHVQVGIHTAARSGFVTVAAAELAGATTAELERILFNRQEVAHGHEV